MDVLEPEWTDIETGSEEGLLDRALAFHDRLSTIRVLDPACGTGNFLYVAMELMKRLEGEVLESVLNLGGKEALGLSDDTVDPHQFIGIEKNARAAAIAELVIWIGYLQWHFRTRSGMPNEPRLSTPPVAVQKFRRCQWTKYGPGEPALDQWAIGSC